MIGWLRALYDHPQLARVMSTSFGGTYLAAVATFVGGLLVVMDAIVFQVFSSSDAEGARLSHLLHLAHCTALAGALVILVPARVAGWIEGARVGRAFDQLVVTGVSPVWMHAGSGVLGLMASALVLLVSLPFTAVAMSFGGLEWGIVLDSYLRLAGFGAVLTALVLGLSVLEREWTVGLLVSMGFLQFGMFTALPFRDVARVIPSALAELIPVRAFWRQTEIHRLFDLETGASARFLADPAVFHTTIPIEWFSLLLWSLVIAGSLALIVLGPLHQFRPGLNTFGSVVLPGDRKRHRWRRMHWILSRRVELAFLYENRPRWVGRWEGLLRGGLDLAVVLFLWGSVVGLVYQGLPSLDHAMEFWQDEGESPAAGPVLGQDMKFHACFWTCVGVFLLWILFRVDSHERTHFVHRFGVLRLGRTTLQVGVFALLLAALFGTHWWTLESAIDAQPDQVVGGDTRKAASVSTVIAVPDDALIAVAPDAAALDETADGISPEDSTPSFPVITPSYERYRSQWERLLGATALLLTGIFLAGRVFSYWFRHALAGRIMLAIAVIAYFSTTAMAFAFAMEGHHPAFLRPLVFLCPGVLLEELPRDVPWSYETRAARFWISTSFLVAGLFLMFLWCAWRTRRAEKHRVEQRHSRAATVAATGLVALGVLFAGMSPCRAQGDRTDQDLPELPLRVEVERGFGSVVSAAGNDRFTLQLENPSDEDWEGTFWLEVGEARSGIQSFFVSRQSERTVRWRRSAAGDRALLELPGELVFRIGDRERRIEVFPADSSWALGGRRASNLRMFLVADLDGGRTREWAHTAEQRADSRVVGCSLRALPVTAADYVGIDSVLLCDVDLGSLLPTQRRALFDFVCLGGSLVLCGEYPDLERVPEQDLRRLLEPEARQTVRWHGEEFEQVVLPGGQRLSFTVPLRDELPFASIRRYGPGSVLHCALDPRRESARWLGEVEADAETVRQLFWSVFQSALPAGSFPITGRCVNWWDVQLRDSSASVRIVLFLVVYVLVMVLACVVLARKRVRGAKLWLGAGVVTAGIVVLARPVVAKLTDVPSPSQCIEVCWWTPGGEDAVLASLLTVYSAGREVHEFSEPDGTVSMELADSFHRGSPVLAPVDSGNGLRVQPWERTDRMIVGPGGAVDGPFGHAVWNEATQVLTMTLEPNGHTVPTDFQVLVCGVGADHHRAASLSNPAGWPSGEFSVDVLGERVAHRSSPFQLESADWSYLWQTSISFSLDRVNGGDGTASLDVPSHHPRVLLLWATEEDPERPLPSPHFLFTTRANRSSLANLPARWQRTAKEREDGSYDVERVHRVVVVDLPLKIERQ